MTLGKLKKVVSMRAARDLWERNMRNARRIGPFKKELQEIVSITGDRFDGSTYEERNQTMIIMPSNRASIEMQGFITQDADYIGLISPINFYVHVNDIITRQPRTEESPRGSSSGELQTFTVEEIQTIKGKQLLYLRDRRVVR